MTLDTTSYKQKLLAEKAELEKELATLGRRNPDNPEDWEATATTEEHPAERDEVADKIESFEENTAIMRQLEARYDEIKNALGRIDASTYGICLVCGKPIEEERLRANQAAATCKQHMK